MSKLHSRKQIRKAQDTFLKNTLILAIILTLLIFITL